jgi:hypothetical protein
MVAVAAADLLQCRLRLERLAAVVAASLSSSIDRGPRSQP